MSAVIESVEDSSVVGAEDETDRELLRRISASDRDAFAELYRRYHQRLGRFLIRVMRQYDDAEDVINDTLLVVWQRAADFRGESRVSTWITGIAYRCALRSIRRSATRHKVVELEAAAGGAVTNDATQSLEDRQLLAQGLALLPFEQRVVLVLAYYMDRSCEDIAAIVECPVNTVKTRMFHGRRKLRTILSEAAPQ